MRYVPGIEVVSNRDTLRDAFVKRSLFHTDFYRSVICEALRA